MSAVVDGLVAFGVVAVFILLLAFVPWLLVGLLFAGLVAAIIFDGSTPPPPAHP